MKQYKYRVNPGKFYAIMVFSALMLVVGIVLFWMNRTLSGLIFTIIAVGYGCAGLLSGVTITLDRDGVRRSFFGKTLMKMDWQQVAEVGVAGVKVFHSQEAKKTGTLYIYLSPHRMTEDERFQMMCKWPPRGMPYLAYDKDRLDAVQLYWSNDIVRYNVGKQEI